MQDSSAALDVGCLFCNARTMPDRIVLDSAKRMIARRCGNPYGYTYYEWKNKGYEKSYEEIQIWPMKYKSAVHTTDSGQYKSKELNSFTNSYTAYFRVPYNKKEPYNGTWTAHKIQNQLDAHATDSMLKLYPLLKDSIRVGGILWNEINFYENGKIKSNGILLFPRAGTSGMSDVGNPISKRYKIGLWLYYNSLGKVYYKEQVAKPVQTN